MGNCNFKAEKDKDSVNGIIIAHCSHFLTFLSNFEKPFPVPICHWKGGLWQSVESGKKERERGLCNERNVESSGDGKEKRLECHE